MSRIDESKEAQLRSLAGRNNSEALQRLLASGVNVNAADEQGNTALHNATRHGQPSNILHLLAAKAHAEVSNQEGCTTLSF